MVFILIGITLCMGGGFLVLFLMAAKSGEFEDMEAGALEMLRGDEARWRAAIEAEDETVGA